MIPQMNHLDSVLIIGSGGREHAIAKALSFSSRIGTIYCAPGNAGMIDVADIVPLNLDNKQTLLDFIQTNKIKLVIIDIPEHENQLSNSTMYSAICIIDIAIHCQIDVTFIHIKLIRYNKLNKSNSTARAVQADANLLRTSTACAFFTENAYQYNV